MLCAISKKLEVGDASAIEGASAILQSCGINAEEARQIVEELNTLVAELDHIDISDAPKQNKGRRRAKGKQKKKERHADHDPSRHLCQHCGGDDAHVACMSCATGSRPSSADANVKDVADAIARGYLMCARCDREEHAELKGHFKVALNASSPADEAAENSADSSGPRVTIGLIGHPNVGKSSVLNALAGKKIVSVSHTPGHTKRLQTIMITPDICICDCPGLVFPFVGVPKYLQELCGLYPYSQVRSMGWGFGLCSSFVTNIMVLSLDS